jgi:predicted DCC family thiol-disulfide oxidoreductase YuxK
MTHQEFMAEIQGRLPDGSWLTGVEVFRRMYSAIGFGWIVSATRWPIVSPVLDWGYKAFAKRRLALTGRCSLENAACRR